MGFTIRQFFITVCLLVAMNVKIDASFAEFELSVLSRNSNYKDAVDLCRRHGMNIVKIKDEETNQMVYNFAVKRNLGQYWIDGNRGPGGVQWVYNDGNQMSYNKWQPGEPNNSGIENCIHGLFFKNGFWNDINCNIRITAICYAEKSTGNIVTIEESQLLELGEKADFKTAINLCKYHGMNLIKVQNEQTNQVVYDYAVRKGLGEYWMDANDITTEGLWVYNDGNRIVYNKWYQGEPNNAGNEDCLHGLFYKNGFWNDINCNKKISVICYKNLQPTNTIETETETRVKSKIETVNIYLTNEKASYDDAVQYCRSQNLKLIYMEDATMNKAVYDMASRKSLGSYWIDGNDKNQRGSWVDSNGNALTYKNFKSSSSDNSESAHCINVDQNESWNRVSCDSKNTVICFENKT